ncbi:hypothetical protein R3I94_016770 [Phoxinus phoxinus]
MLACMTPLKNECS